MMTRHGLFIVCLIMLPVTAAFAQTSQSGGSASSSTTSATGSTGAVTGTGISSTAVGGSTATPTPNSFGASAVNPSSTTPNTVIAPASGYGAVSTTPNFATPSTITTTPEGFDSRFSPAGAASTTPSVTNPTTPGTGPAITPGYGVNPDPVPDTFSGQTVTTGPSLNQASQQGTGGFRANVPGRLPTSTLPSGTAVTPSSGTTTGTATGTTSGAAAAPGPSSSLGVIGGGVLMSTGAPGTAALAEGVLLGRSLDRPDVQNSGAVSSNVFTGSGEISPVNPQTGALDPGPAGTGADENAAKQNALPNANQDPANTNAGTETPAANGINPQTGEPCRYVINPQTDDGNSTVPACPGPAPAVGQ